MNTILRTPRLLLREMSLADLDFVASMLAHPEVMRFYPKCYTREGAKTWIERQTQRYARNGHGLWLAVERESQRPVGQVGLTMQRAGDVEEPEIGYLIHRPFWRRGFATEAAAATRDHALEVLGKPRVVSLIRPENTSSQGVARKIGMTSEGRLVEHGGFPHLVFSVCRREASSEGQG